MSYYGNIVNLCGSKFLPLTSYFQLGDYQNGHRYVRFRIQTKEQTVEMSKQLHKAKHLKATIETGC